MSDICRLHSKLETGPTDGPYQVSVEFNDIDAMLNQRYPGSNTAKLIRVAFPNVVVKRIRAKGIRSTHYVGVRKRLATNTVEQQLLGDSGSSLIAANAGLAPQVQIVSPPACPTASVMECEIQKILSSNGILVHGPDTPDHLCTFSIRGVVEELKQLAPTLFGLFVSLGDTKRNSKSHDTDSTETHEDMKAMFSLCSLLNARSQKVKGIQLFISMMLIARATNKQVCYDYYHSNCM